MRCPVCLEVQLVMAERQGIEIDYCPECRGVWLDRGELDKIIDRTAPAAPPRTHHYDYGHRDTHYEDYDYHRRKRRGGFLGELFDFD